MKAGAHEWGMLLLLLLLCLLLAITVVVPRPDRFTAASSSSAICSPDTQLCSTPPHLRASWRGSRRSKGSGALVGSGAPGSAPGRPGIGGVGKGGQ